MQIGTMQRSHASSIGASSEVSSAPKFTARLLAPDEVKEHIGVAKGAMDYLSQYVYGKPDSEVATMPDHPANDN